MTSGTLEYVIQCSPNGKKIAVSPCGLIGAAGYSPVMVQAYVISPASAQYFEALATPFDYAYASGLWTLSFSMVVGLFVVARKFGTIINFVRFG